MYDDSTAYRRAHTIVAAVHNTAMVAFSAWTFLTLTSYLYKSDLSLISIHKRDFPMADPILIRVVSLFAFSKVWEFMDTFLLLARGRPASFLQEFHHTGAYLVWRAGLDMRCHGVILPTIFNSFIHTFMYAYYLSSMTKNSFVRRFRPVMTAAQIIQLVVGNVSIFFADFWKKSVSCMLFEVCFVSYAWVLVVLFGVFFSENYLRVKTKKRV